MSATSEDLPEPDTPVTSVRVPRGISTSMPRRLCSAAPMSDDRLPRSGFLRSSGIGIVALMPQVGARERVRALDHLLGYAGAHDLAAMLARTGAHVDHVVGRANGLLVVLDDDDRVAQVAQTLHRRDQPGVVALVKPDRRLVEDVEDAHQPCADLRRKPDALCLSAGERCRAAVESEVVETDIDQEPQTLDDLLDDAAGDLLVAVGKLDALEERE